MKIEALAVAAIAELAAGRDVLYVAHRSIRINEVIRQMEQADTEGVIRIINHGFGEWRIVATSGAQMQFRATNVAGRGMTVDTLAFDDDATVAVMDVMPALMGSSSPKLITVV